MDNVDVYNLSIGLILLNFFVDVYEEIMLEFWNED